MNSHLDVSSSIRIRDARVGDIDGIAAVVGDCGPYLTNHARYLYLIYTRCFSATCAVAVEDGTIVGWCSMLPTSRGEYFLHQLGIAPQARGKGVALRLFAFLVAKLRTRHGDRFRIEFTVDRRNKTVHRLTRGMAERFGLSLQKLPEAVPPLGDGSDEELYEMTPICVVDVELARRA